MKKGPVAQIGPRVEGLNPLPQARSTHTCRLLVILSIATSALM